MPLKLRRAAEQFPKAGWPSSDDDLVVMHEDTVIGVIKRMGGGPSDNRWLWSITALYMRPGVRTMNGTTDSKDEAKAAFAKTLRQWLEHIGAADLTDEVIAKHRIGSGQVGRAKL